MKMYSHGTQASEPCHVFDLFSYSLFVNKTSKPKEISETRLSSEKENIVKNEASPKPRKLSRPKKEKEVEVKKEVIEEKKTIERAANDPRNK